MMRAARTLGERPEHARALVELLDEPIPVLDLGPGLGPEVRLPQGGQLLGGLALLLHPGEVLQVVEPLPVVVAELLQVVDPGALEVAREVLRRARAGLL